MRQHTGKPTVPTRVSVETHSKMRIAAQALEVTMAQIIDWAVEDWIQSHRDEIQRALREKYEKGLAL